MRADVVRSAALERQGWCGEWARSTDWRSRWGDALRERAALRADEVGRVRVAGAREPVAWSHEADGFAVQSPRWRAALADHYLWWAHRLYGYAREVSRSTVDLYLGQLAAQRGLACLRDIGAGFQHVDRHLGCVADREVA